MEKEVLYTSKGMIRTRINNNLIEVKNAKPEHKNKFTNNECNNVKRILHAGLETTKPYWQTRGSRSKRTPEQELAILIEFGSSSRKDLLRVAVLLGTSRNEEVRDTIMKHLKQSLGFIDENDYKYITEMIYKKDPIIVDQVNQYLCNNFRGFKHWHEVYFDKYYGV